ncbi:MAG: phosphate ABC transporter permease subunit PstC, partial [Proteobacteria bacterium]|nr:phosphate ABC transporter permease subunit PstC [Pseudomonadota bacterium]
MNNPSARSTQSRNILPPPRLKRRRLFFESVIEGMLFLSALSAVFITLAIVYVLVSESLAFFAQVSLIDFVTDTQWTIMFEDKHYGIAPLLAGTLVTSGVGLLVAVPLGTIIAIYLSEFA